jgi:glycosyltransferase involved in cell wall biosynthesis
MIKALIENGQEINLTPIGDIQLDHFFEMYIKDAEKNKDRYSAKEPSLFLFHDEFSNQAAGNPLFTFSIFETSQIKTRSFNMLENGPTDVILTTTSGHLEYLVNQKITKPIEVVNEGVDETLYNTIPIDKYLDTKKFTYITMGKKEERKNTDLLLRLFIFNMKEKDVALICHTFNPFINKTKDHPFKNLACWSGVNPLKHGFEYKGFNGKAHLFIYKNCEIYFTVPTIHISNMPSLLHSANVGIQVSRGEGWDLPATELMACGIPIIATNCLGHKEYINDNCPDIQKELIIKKETSTIAHDGMWFNGDQGIWDNLNTLKLEELLTYTFDNQSKYANKSDELADYMSKKYSWNNAAQKLIEVIKKYRG